MLQIIPSILATSEAEFVDKLNRIQSSQSFQEGWIHLDFMDNQFVPNMSVDASILESHKPNLAIEAHLMVEYPASWIDQLAKIGVARIVVHGEESAGLQERIQQAKQHGIQIGIALNPETPIEIVVPFMSTIDCVLVMSVHPGFSGQDFIRESLDKVRELTQLRGSSTWLIGMDGGIHADTVKEAMTAGADYCIMASGLLEGDIDGNLESIWENLRI